MAADVTAVAADLPAVVAEEFYKAVAAAVDYCPAAVAAVDFCPVAVVADYFPAVDCLAV
jgi:hypothetical protein